MRKLQLTFLISLNFWVTAGTNITGVLFNQYGKTISDAEIFINNTHVYSPEEDGSFSIYTTEDVEHITIHSFQFFSHNIRVNFTTKDIALRNLYLIPKLIWTDKVVQTPLNSDSDNGKFVRKKFEIGKSQKSQYGKWLLHGKSKFYNDENKLITTLKFKKGKLIYIKRNHLRKRQKNRVYINKKNEVIVDLTT